MEALDWDGYIASGSGSRNAVHYKGMMVNLKQMNIDDNKTALMTTTNVWDV